MLILIYDSDGNPDILKIFFEHGKLIIWEIQKGGGGGWQNRSFPPAALQFII